MDSFFLLLHLVAAAVYGLALTLTAIALVLACFLDLGEVRPAARRFMAAGPALGLAMGALILGGLVSYRLDHGSFTWPLDTPAQQLVAAKHALFGVLWVSAFHLEIWTLEPLRRIESGRSEGDDAAAARRVAVQAALNAALFWAIAGLAYA